MGKVNRSKPIIKLLFLGIVSLCLVIAIVPRMHTVYDLNAQKQDLEKKKIELQLQNEELKKKMAEAESLKTIEKIAREQLGMVKSGEKAIIQVVPNDSSGANE